MMQGLWLQVAERAGRRAWETLSLQPISPSTAILRGQQSEELTVVRRPRPPDLVSDDCSRRDNVESFVK
jgi:hypothetical protein